jgi:negative regulator of genetic competence, sporulation and motility
MVVYFTSLLPGQLPRLAAGKAPVPVIFAFDDADSLTEGCVKAFRRYSHRIYKSSLHLLQGSYRLTVYPLDYADRLSILFLSEYGRIRGEGEILAAFVEEHGRQLIADNALDVLADYFG